MKNLERGQNLIKILKGDRLIDGNGEVVRKPIVIIEGSRIKEIRRKDEVIKPIGANMIEMNGCTLMPGLMDIHIHCSGYNILTFDNYRVALFEITPQLQMLYTLLHAQICFEMGFTTLRCIPWHNPWSKDTSLHNAAELVAIRDAINAGIIAGPRFLASGKVCITGSHLEMVVPRSALRQSGSTADGPWELRKAVREKIRIGCDYIKAGVSAGVGRGEEDLEIRDITQEELDAIVDEAHAFNKHCACHCFTPKSQKMAIKAGVDTIEHCMLTDEEVIAMMKAENKIIVPTLAKRSDRAINVRRKMGGSESVLSKMKKIQPYAKETFQKLHEAGVKMALGTDTSMDPERGSNAYELEIYVDYGMTPMEAIQTATKNAAEAIWLDRDIGTLEVGKFADIINTLNHQLC